MAKRILFQPEEYRELSTQEQELLADAYAHAIDVIHRNITPKGFSACSLKDNQIYGTDVNYRSVWARDGAITLIYTLDLEDEQVQEAQRNTLETLMRHQTEGGQIPANVRIETDVPEYCGVGGIASIDSIMWVIIAMYRYCKHTGDWDFARKHLGRLQRAMYWLGAHDSNNCGLLEIPEASDWADLFGYSYHVLYDEVLWHRTIVAFSELLKELDDHEKAKKYAEQADFVRGVFLRSFWPSTNTPPDGIHPPSFADKQYSLGDARYLIAQISPFSFSWRCDVYGNLLAHLTGLLDRERAMMTFRFLWGVGANDPGLVKNLYPPVQAGDPEWQEYYTVNLLNLPNHYHNGGIWPFIGGMWVRYIHKLGMDDLAKRELVKLARLCKLGVSQEWEFNEWHHGVTARPMGKAYQAWSAASFIQACHDLHLDSEGIDYL